MIFALNTYDSIFILVDIYTEKNFKFIENILKSFKYNIDYYDPGNKYPIFFGIDTDARKYSVCNEKRDIRPIQPFHKKISFLEFLKRLK